MIPFGVVPLSSASSLVQSGSGTVSLGMNVVSSGTLQFSSPITLTHDATFTSGGGSISLGSVDGDFGVTLTAGSGSITLGTIGGTTPLANIAIQSASSVTLGAVTGNSLSAFTETGVTGLTQFSGALSLGSGGLNVTGTQFSFGGAVSSTGPVAIVQTGGLTLGSSASMTLSDTFSESGGGSVSLGAGISTSGFDLEFADPITLTAPVTINTGSGDLTLASTVSGGYGLTLIGGQVLIGGLVSGLSSFTASGSSILQNAAISTSGAVSETGAITLGAGITTAGSNITLTGNVVTTSSLTLSTGSGSGNVNVTGTLNSSISGLNYSVTTGSGSSTFQGSIGNLSPFGNFTVSSSDITLANFGNSTPGATGTLSLSASDSINFNGTTYTGGVQNYTAANQFNFNAGSLTTLTSSNQAVTFNTGTLELAAANDLTINSNGGTITVSPLVGIGGGQTVIFNATVGNVNVEQMGTALNDLGPVTLIGTTVSHPDPIYTTSLTIEAVTPEVISSDKDFPGSDHTYNAPVIISSPNISLTFANLTFNSTLDSSASGTNNLSITVGTGNDILFNGPVGGIAPLSSITLVSSSPSNIPGNVTANSTFSVGSFLQEGGSGNTSFLGGIASTASGGIAITAGGIDLVGSISTANGGPITLNGPLTATGVTVSSSGSFTAGSSTISGTVATSDRPISFTGAVVTNGNLSLNSVSATGANISFDSTVDGANNLTLAAGTGSISFAGAVGSGTRLGKLTISSAGNVTASGLIKASSILQSAGTGLTTFAGLDTNTSNGVQLTGNAFSIGETLTLTSNGRMVITNSGNLSLTPSGSVSIPGALTQNGSGSVTALSGSFTVGGAVSFASSVAIPASSTASFDTSTANQPISFAGGIAGPGNLSLALGSGALTFANNLTHLGTLTVSSASTVNAQSISASSISVTASSPATFQGSLASTGVISLTGAADIILNAGLTAGAGCTISNNGILHLNAGSSSTISGGAFSQTGSGTVQLSGTLTSVNQNISFADPITLVGASSLLTTSSGNISFGGTIDGLYSLDLTAGSGSITFGGALGSNEQMGALTVHSVNGITYPSVSALSLSQIANSGSTVITGPLTTTGSAGISLVGGAISQNGNITTSGSGPFSVQHSGTFTVGTGLTTTISGAYLDSALSAGSVLLGSSITTLSDSISFLGSGSVTLGADVTIDSGSTVGGITFASPISGAHNFTLIGNEGSIALEGALNINGLTIVSAADVTAAAIAATSIAQTAGSGLTHFQGAVSTTSSAGISLQGTGFTFDSSVTTTGSGAVSITNVGGTLTIGPSSVWSVNGSVSKLGTGSSILEGAVTAEGVISFAGPVSTSGTPSLNSSNNPISFLNTLNGPGGLSLTAGSGDVSFDSTIGETSSFGALSVVSANNLTASGSITASSLVQSSGSGTSLFQQNITATGSLGIQLTGNAFSFQGNLTTQSGSGGSILVSNASSAVFAPETVISSDGSFEQANTGAVSLGANITTNNAALSFAGPITLTSSCVFGSGTGDMTFSNSIDPTSISSQGLTATAAGTSTITFNAIGQTTNLGPMNVTGYNIATLGNASCLSYTTTSTGLWSFGTLSGSALTFRVNGTDGMTFNVHSTFRHGDLNIVRGPISTVISGGTISVVPGGNLFAGGSYSISGTGSSHLAGTLSTNNASITFGVPLVLGGDLSISSGAEGGDIVFNQAVSGSSHFSLDAGAGNLTFNESVGLGAPFTSFEITSATNTTFESSLTASSLSISDVTALTSFNGAVNVEGAIALSGFAFTFNDAITTTNSGSLTISNSGPLTIASNEISLAGALSQTTTGPISAGGSWTLSNAGVTIQGPITLANDLAVSTGGGEVIFQNEIEGGYALSVAAGTGSITSSVSISLSSSPLSSLTFSGNDISLTGIGSSETGLSGPLTLTAGDEIILHGIYYTAGSQTYASNSSTNFEMGATTFLLSEGPVSFSGGVINLSDGSNLSIHTSNADLQLVDITAFSPENITISLGSGTAHLQAMGGGVNEVNVSAGQIFFGGSIVANSVTFTALNSIANEGSPVSIDSTETATFNAFGGDVGSLSSPILVHTEGQILAGACSSCLADFEGSSSDNTVNVIESNPPCILYFNGVELRNCHVPPPPPPPSPPSSNKIAFPFAVPGMDSSAFNLASDFFFLPYFFDDRYIHKEGYFMYFTSR
jgi:hypothetical protein